MSTQYGLQVTSTYTAKEYSQVVIVVKAGEKREIDRAGAKGLLAIQVQAGAELVYTEYVQEAGLYHTYIYIEGENSTVSIVSKVMLSTGMADISHKVFHSNKETVSHIQTRGVVSDNAEVIYTSEIRAEKNHTDIQGTEKADFLVKDNARVSGIPALSISTDNVVCSHSLSIVPMSMEKIAYLHTKGYNRNEAEQILTDSFLDI
ncbi:MAG: hypothetical protein RI996_145 [Candidatus Parcubacteria bacterium]|jgi:Fe-S cluster assembly scaffold protein SufB